ncbi:DUF2723 domain-containing protein [bacterium]|nr:DUF2723 domain-containing protein [bacterium]
MLFWDLVLAIAAFLLPLLVSLPLLGNDLIAGEYAEFVLGTASLGIVHCPGYPLYLLSAKFLGWLAPWGTDIWRMNFASLVFGSGSSFIMYLTGRRLRFPAPVSLATAWALFFSPFIWQAALLSHHFTFHLMLLCLCLYLTLGIISPPFRLHSQGRWMIWAFLCGIAGGQFLPLLTWAITAFILGLAIGLPRHPAKKFNYVLIFICLILGILLPYVYLPLRMPVSGAFLNTDFAFHYAELRQNFSPAKLGSWLFWYITAGYQKYFIDKSFGSSLFQVGQALISFVRSYSFFGLAIMLWGLLLNVHYVFLQRPKWSHDRLGNTSRLIVMLLPLFALGGGALLFSGHTPAFHLGLCLAGAYWTLSGLNYCYYQLGRRSERNSKFLTSRATIFGLIVVLLVPLFSLLQSYRHLRAQVRMASEENSNLFQMRNFIQALPPRTILAYPYAELGFAAAYLQSCEKIRPDIFLAPFSKLWPDTSDKYSPSSQDNFLQSFSLAYNLAFTRYWVKGLTTKLSPAYPAYLLSPPLQPSVPRDHLAQTFELTEAYPPLRIRIHPGETYELSIYQIRPQPAKNNR